MRSAVHVAEITITAASGTVMWQAQKKIHIIVLDIILALNDVEFLKSCVCNYSTRKAIISALRALKTQHSDFVKYGIPYWQRD
jgi:hypothetical protein